MQIIQLPLSKTMHLSIRLEIAQYQRPALQEAVESSPCKTCLSEGEKQNPSHKYLFPAKTLPALVKWWEG